VTLWLISILKSSSTDSILFGTVFGMIGTILVIPDETFSFLSAVEKALKTVITGLGGLNHDEWRAFHNDRRSGTRRTTIDGDLIEMFMELPKSAMDLVVSRLNDDLRTKAVHESSKQQSVSLSRSSISADPGSSANPVTIYTTDEVLRKIEDISRLH